jgi:hypothetical protein
MGLFLEQLRYAFAVEPRETPEDLPDALKQLADNVVDAGMAIPAIMFLETTAPLSFLAGQTLHAFTAFATPFIDDAALREIGDALEDKRTVRKLIEHIETIAKIDR